MAFLNFWADWWQAIAVAVIFVVALGIKLHSLWSGNIGEWLISICAEMEREFGSGTGFLKLRGAYDTFISTFPVVSKIISFKTFSEWVDIALEKLNKKIDTNVDIKSYITPPVEPSEVKEADKNE